MNLFRRSIPRRPRRTFTLLALSVLICAHAAAAPGGTSLRVAPPAPWVHELPLPGQANAPGTDERSGKLYVLIDEQVRLGSPTVAYSRRAWTPLSSAAVQDAPEIEIDFDPSYERLVIHHVRLLRNGRDVFGLKASDVRVIQQETDLDQQIYSGQLTAVVFLRDLRPGDVVDYAYSIEGSNPILQGAFDDVLWLAYSAPVRRLRYVINAPSGTELHIAPRNTEIAPRVDVSGAWRSFTWEAHDIPATVADDDEPGWFDPDPRIEVSSFDSWGAVARWATALFESQLRPSPEIAALANRWRHAPGGLPEAATEAARFVQDDVRYLGIEMGPSSHRPHPPAQVLRQRFGDCKDKALLLVALLRELGIDAAPALVDTERRRGLDDVQPSAFAFDHAVVHANLGGRTVWIDATESDKGGAVEDCEPPEFERALVLRPGVEGLTVIPHVEARDPRTRVKEIYTLGTAGAPTRLDVVTTFRGTEADDMRHTLATTAPGELAKKYLDDYARENADIKPLGPPVPRDDRARNVVTVTESYEMATFWKNGQRELYGWQVRENLPSRAASTRTTPLSVPYPVHVSHEVVVHAPAPFRLSGRRQTIADHAFLFTSELTVAGQDLRLLFDYRSLADSVPPEKIKPHQEAVERVRDALTFVVHSDLTEPGGGSGPLLLLLPLAVLVLLVATVVVQRWRRRARADTRPV
jgi:transglutaminase-like putative cysteine protease